MYTQSDMLDGNKFEYLMEELSSARDRHDEVEEALCEV